MFVKMVSLSLSPPAVFYAWSWSSPLFKRRSAAAAARGGEGEEREWNVEDFSTECIEKEAPWVEEPSSPPKKKRTRESGEGRKGRKRTHSL